MKPVEAGLVARQIERDSDRPVERGVVRGVVASGVEAVRHDARNAVAIGRSLVRNAPHDAAAAARRAAPVARAAGHLGMAVARATADRALAHVPGPDDLAHAGADTVARLAQHAANGGAGAGTAWTRFAKYRTRWEA